MGNTTSNTTSNSTEDNIAISSEITGAYQSTLQHCGCSGTAGTAGAANASNVSGGSDVFQDPTNMDAYVGSNEEESNEKLLANIATYTDSVQSRAKTRVIKAVLDAAAAMQLVGEGSTPAEKLRSLGKKLPLGERFRPSDEMHRKVCTALAQAVNQAYGYSIIDASMPAEVICQQLGDTLSSLTAGMHTEFLAVYKDIQRVMKNLQILRTTLKQNMEQVRTKAGADATISDRLQLNYDLNEMLLKEVDRQLQLLSNMTNVHLDPTMKDLTSMLKSGKDVFGTIHKLDVRTGEVGFGKVIADTLRGMHMTAQYALVLEQALKNVGMTMQEYQSMKNVNELRDRAVSLGDKLTGDELRKFLKSLELLEENLSKRNIGTDSRTGSSSHSEMSRHARHGASEFAPPDDMSAYQTQGELEALADAQGVSTAEFGHSLGEVTGSGSSMDMIGGCCTGGVPDEDATRSDNSTAGGMHSALGGHDNLYPKTTMQRRVKDRKKLRDLIFNTFTRQLNGLLDKFVGALNILSEKVGTSIPLSDQLDGLRQSLARINIELGRKKQIYYALIGYYRDAMSQSKRDQFVGELRMVMSFIDSIIEMPLYRESAPHFQAVKIQAQAVLDLLDRFSRDVAERFGASDHAASANGANKDHIEGGASDDDEDDHLGGMHSVADAADAMDDEIEGGDEPTIRYRSMKTINDAIRTFDYKYRVAQIRSNLSRAGREIAEYSKSAEKINANSIAEVLKADQKIFKAAQKTIEADRTAGTLSAEDSSAANAFLVSQWEAKKKFWSAMEAVDAYMRHFTNGVATSPNDIKDIQAALDDIEIIRDWYSESTGNRLAAVIDHFGGNEALAGASGEEHYYKALETVGDGNVVAVGDLTTSVSASKGEKARKALVGAMSGMTALKNLLSIFVHLGSKFAGQDLASKVFLTPAQIYSNIMSAMVAMSFVQGKDLELKSTVSPDGVLTAPAGAPAGAWDDRWKVSMRLISTTGGILNFDREDDYFVLMLKAIAAKVLTVTGLYDVLDRPHEFNGIRPIRAIIGGAETPQVVEGALALYLRLPLLCQFWREIFGFDESDETTSGNKFDSYSGIPMNNNSALKISMVPDLDGVFGGLIRIVFRKNKFLDTSAYTDDDLKDIITECNAIFARMSEKYPQNTVMETIYELVAEVNRRYGIVSKVDRDQFEAEFGFRQDYSDGSTDRYGNDPDASDVAILPGELEESIALPSGAERLLEGTEWSRTEKRKESGYGISPDHQKILYRFRCAIDSFFQNPSESYSFNGAIKSVQAKLRRETRGEERLQLAMKLMRGVDVYSKVDGIKYIFFHETVVAGLNSLSGIHTLLAEFQKRAVALSYPELVRQTIAWMNGKANGEALTSDGLTTHLTGWLSNKDTNRVGWDEASAKAFVEKLLGKDESALCNSGSDDKVAGGYTIRPTHDAQNPGVQRFAGAKRTADGVEADTGLASVLKGVKIADMEGLLKDGRASGDRKVQREKVICFFRYLFNREFMMQEIVEMLYGMEAKGFTQVKMSEGNLFVNLGGLKQIVNDLFEHVSSMVDIMRPHISEKVLRPYVSKLSAGSLYYLREQILEKIIRGRPKSDAHPGYKSIDEQMQGLSKSFKWLTMGYEFDGSGLTAAGAASKVVSKKSKNSFAHLFARMIFYDGERPQSGIAPSSEASEVGDAATGFAATDSPKIVDWNTNPYEALHISGAPGHQQLDTRFAARFKQLYTWGSELTYNRSLLFVFNQLVAKFIQAMYDPATKKIYTGLLGEFANGVFSKAVNDHRFTYPDVAPLVSQAYSGGEVLKAPPALRFSPENPDVTDARPNVITAVNALVDVSTLALAAPFDAAITADVKELFPYDTTTGRTSQESDSRKKMLVDLILYLGHARSAGVDEYRKALTEATKQLGGRGAYSTGRVGAPQYIVPQENLSKHDTTNPGRAGLQQPSYEDSLLLFARGERVDNAMETDSIGKLGPEVPRGDLPGTTEIADVLQFGNRADPDGEHVLFTSLAVVIRTLVSTRTAQGQSVYLAENMADVPLYMKEKMRAHLPALNMLFAELSRRSEFVSKMLRSVDITRHFVNEPSVNPWPFELKKAGGQSCEDARDRFGGICDSIIRGSRCLEKCSDATLREVGDDPKYLEIYQGSIEDYRQQNGNLPLMPVSSVMSMMRNVAEKETEHDLEFSQFLPISSMGEAQFKWAYGIRQLIHAQDVKIEAVPGWTHIVEAFNMGIDSRLQAPRDHTDALLRAEIYSMRYIFMQRWRKGIMTPHVSLACVNEEYGSLEGKNRLHSGGAWYRAQFMADGKTQLTNSSSVSLTQHDEGLQHTRPVYSLRQRTARTIAVTESSSRGDQMKKIIRAIAGDDEGRPANTLAVQNVIDLNIMPINVHALMRDIPLATTYNYAYTCDQMICELLYGSGNAAINELCQDDTRALRRIGSPKDVLAALLMKPALDVSAAATEGRQDTRTVDSRSLAQYVQGMLQGSTGEEGLSRPKMLSDQIYGKVIFGDAYGNRAGLSDLGPAVRYSIKMPRGPLYAAMVDMFGAAGISNAVDIARDFLDDQMADIKSLEAKVKIAARARDAVPADEVRQQAIKIMIIGRSALCAANLLSRGKTDADVDGLLRGALGKAAAANLTVVDGKLKITDDFLRVSTEFSTVQAGLKRSLHGLSIDGALAIDLSGLAPAATLATLKGALDNNRTPHSVREAPIRGAERPNTLKYLEGGELRSVGVEIANLGERSQERFDSRLVRNIVFVVNLVRLLRVRLQRDLTYTRDITVRSAPITRNAQTEFNGNDSLRRRLE